MSRSEERLVAIAAQTAYPSTPDLWSGVRWRLARETKARAQRGVRRLAFALAALLLILAVGTAAGPAARAALLRSLRVGVVRIFFPEATPSAPAPSTGSPVPSPSPVVLMPPFDLAGQTTLAEAERAIGKPLLLPTYPPDLGTPDLVFLQNWDGPLVVLVWTKPEDPQQARLSLHILGPGTFAGKSAPEVVVATEVNGQPALWTQGPHQLMLRSGHDTFRNLVSGNVLIWEQDGLTYRLETDVTLDEAVRIAESLR
ncbi:MAG TPA: hypothetical protein VLD63_07650 [Anaerolineales bacterium]|nr:hypothetical protein [Anaerolineales bacterium]